MAAGTRYFTRSAAQFISTIFYCGGRGNWFAALAASQLCGALRTRETAGTSAYPAATGDYDNSSSAAGCRCAISPQLCSVSTPPVTVNRLMLALWIVKLRGVSSGRPSAAR
jgi:hypothetical protein